MDSKAAQGSSESWAARAATASRVGNPMPVKSDGAALVARRAQSCQCQRTAHGARRAAESCWPARGPRMSVTLLQGARACLCA